MLNWIYGLAAKLRQKLSEKGQGMVEYAMILAAVAIIAVVVIWKGVPASGGTAATSGLKSTIQKAFGNAEQAIEKGNEKASTETGNL